MIHLQCYILNLYIFVGLSFCLLELSSLKSLTLWVFSFSFFFLVKVEMSHSRARLSNPALYAFQPHTPYLLLTASNWNRDHIFHTAPQQRSLLEPTFHKGREVFLFSSSLATFASWYLSFRLACSLPAGLINSWPWHCFIFYESTSLLADWTVHLLRLKTKQTQWTWDRIRREEVD